MFRIRIKMGPQQQQLRNNKEFTCCFGLHVTTATILIGLWHLFLNILALSLLAVIWRNPHMIQELESSYEYTVDLNAPALPTPLSKVDPPYAYRDHSLNYQYQNFDMGGLVCTCMIAITLMMIYGTIKGKPSHLLPFFCLQIFDFAITTLTAAGYLCYLQAIHRLVAESNRLPWREKLLELSPEELVVVVLVVFVCIVFLKGYAIGIVWRCYKYLSLRQQSMRSLLPCGGMPDLSGANLTTMEEQRAYSTLLPDYDEALAQFMKQAPPPSYQAAMSNYRATLGANNNNSSTNNNNVDALDADAMLDNNNDIPNNNNTMHINANTPSMRRNDSQSSDEDAVAGAEGTGADSNGGTDSADEESTIVIEDGIRSGDNTAITEGGITPPPSYNDVIGGMVGVDGATYLAMEQEFRAQQPPQRILAGLKGAVTKHQSNSNNESQA